MLKSHRDIDEEIRTVVPGHIGVVVLDSVVFELERLSRKGSAGIRTWANTAITFVAKRHYSVVEHKQGPTDVDVLLVEYALTEKTPTAIATIDNQLRKVLESFNIMTLVPQTKHGLVATTGHAYVAT